MTNTVRSTVPPTTIRVGDTEYTFRVNGRVIFDFEQAMGKTVLQVAGPVISAFVAGLDNKANPRQATMDVITELGKAGGISFIDIATLFWACIGGTDSKLTVREAAELLDPSNITDIVGQMVAAVRAAYPKLAANATAEEAGEPAAPLAG